MSENIQIIVKSEEKEVSLTLPFDCDIWEMGEALKGLLVVWGFHPENVDDLFNIERWSEEKDEEVRK